MSKSVVSNAALQLHCTTPKKSSRPSGHRTGREESMNNDVRTSRYRLLDEREQVREAREIERIQRELQLQRRPPVTTTSRRPTADGRASRRVKESLAVGPEPDEEGDMPPPYDSIYASAPSTPTARKRTFANQKTQEPASPQWTEGDDDEATPASDDDDDDDDPHRRHRVAQVTPLAPASDFQAQVLRELQKLKQAQQKDLEAIQKLQREKDDAERKAKALEATLRARSTPSTPSATTRTGTQVQVRSRPLVLTFTDADDGDESAPPAFSASASQYERMSRSHHDTTDELDYTDSELSPTSSLDAPHKWATATSSLSDSRETSHLTLQRSESPVFAKQRVPPHSRASSARSSTTSQLRASSRDKGDRRPRSARTRDDNDLDADDDEDESRSVSRGRSMRQSRSDTRSHSLSRARSASREDLRRSCAFYEEKERAQHEENERQREAQRRLERASRATPPANLLKRQDEAQRKKREQLQRMEQERDAELSPAKRVRAREVPATTYVATDAFATTEEREQARKERLLKRSQDLMAQAELPARMQLAKEQDQANAKAMEAATAAATSTRMSMAVSVKARRKLQEQLEEEERRRQLMRPKPVPNFTHLQTQWEKALSVKKSKHKPTEPQCFFSARERELQQLRARKDERKQKMMEQEELARRQQMAKQRELLERTKRAGGPRADGPKLTKADELRMKKVQEAIRQQRRQEEQDKMEKERRELRLKEASRRVTAQVKHGESKRKGDYAGDFVELTSVETVAKEKAKIQRDQFRAAVQRNKERLVAAVATKPSLMERFAIDLKREEHKKNALEAVVKQVFQKNFKDMKGILTEEEEELARDLVAADDAADDADSGGANEGGASHRSSKEDAGEGEEDRGDGEDD